MSDKKQKGVSVGEVLGRVQESVVRQSPVCPIVSATYVESIAKRMAEVGYDFTEETMRVLVDYLKGYNIWICGKVGVGKTFFFDCMSEVRRASGIVGIVKLSMIETQGWNMDDARNWIDDYREYDVMIDDVGTEPLMKSWGQEAELFPYLLERRMQFSDRRTHLTSNLNIINIKHRYSGRVSDRFVQYFKMEELKSSHSNRVLRPWKKIGTNGVGVL